MRALIVIALVAVAARADAQPALVLGKPLPDPQLPAGTVTVRAVAGQLDLPLVGVRVTLTVDGKPRYATTDKAGRVTFEGVAAAVDVQAAVMGVVSETFAVPQRGGTRVLLSPKPWKADAADAAPTRQQPVTVGDPSVPAGALDVRLTYNDVSASKPPRGTVVTLVGYARDDTIRVVTRKTDAQGRARFDNLDRSGATAYFAMAQLPRNGKLDRLSAVPIVPDDTPAGMSLVLSSHARTAKSAPIDDLGRLETQDIVAAGKVRVKIAGVVDAKQVITLVDAATKKVVARGAIDKPSAYADLTVPVRAGQVLYAETSANGARYRSLPVQLVRHTGTTVGLYLYPRVMPRYQFVARPAENALVVDALIEISNYAWSPYVVADEVPLPRGAVDAELVDDDGRDVKVTASGLRFTRPLRPGGRNVQVMFEVKGTANRVRWSLDLPFGSWKSSFQVANLPGVTIAPPAGTPSSIARRSDGDYLAVEPIDLLPNQTLALSVQLPRLSALDRACLPLWPDRTSPGVGSPMRAAVATQLDGTRFALSSLRGKPMLVTFMASWDQLSTAERPQIAKLAAAVPGIVPLLVFSDADANAIRPLIDAKAGYRVLLDPPVGAANIGPITTAWGTKLLPESYLIDRKGIVRYYFANARDWSSPEGLACAKALANER